MVRRPYPPGMHGKRRRRGSSEFGVELVEKQKVRYFYGVSDGALKAVVREATRMAKAARGKTKTSALLELLERRLDNVVFRLGLTPSRRIARQLIAHGHFLVNGHRVNVPSRLLGVGDKISIREASRQKPIFEGLAVRWKKYEPPAFLRIDPERAEGSVLRLPLEADNLLTYNLSKVIEFYSR